MRSGSEKTGIPLEGVTNWCLAKDEENLAWLSFDCVGARINTLSKQVLTELDTVVQVLSSEQPDGLIVYSAKTTGFSVGADIGEFDRLDDVKNAEERITKVHEIFQKIEDFSFPTVARVRGFCLGGGLELALACRHIIASNEASTRLGFPEILLGLHPGFGGTVRSIRCCGVSAAMDLMLTGRSIDARRAYKIGLIDRAVPLRHLDMAARIFAKGKHQPRQPPMRTRLMSNRVVRPLMARFLRRQVAKRVSRVDYPAPYSLIDLWRGHGGNKTAMYEAEARSIAHLVVSSTSRNLVQVFQNQERLKALGKGDSTAAKHVHVIGAGVMGGDIAAWCALRGLRVTLQDRDPRFIASAVQRAQAVFERRVKDKYERLATRDRLVPDFSGDAQRHADVIIEAIVEDAGAKCELLRKVESCVRPEALIATNTSSIELSLIGSALDDPGRLVGIHFFNPVARMQLIEIVTADETYEKVCQQAAAFAVSIDRLPLRTKSAPGFLVNRTLSPYMDEAMRLMEEGVAPVEIDRVAKKFGMPMGPVELADTVGLDVCLDVGEVLGQAFGGEPSQLLRSQVDRKRLGRKTNAGFYDYKKGKIIRNSGKGKPLPDSEICDRMVLRLLNEAVACWREQIVADSDLIDVAMVFGVGFAPFRGGPFNYARNRGVIEIISRLRELEVRHGGRFKADPGWQRITDE